MGHQNSTCIRVLGYKYGGQFLMFEYLSDLWALSTSDVRISIMNIEGVPLKEIDFNQYMSPSYLWYNSKTNICYLCCEKEEVYLLDVQNYAVFKVFNPFKNPKSRTYIKSTINDENFSKPLLITVDFNGHMVIWDIYSGEVLHNCDVLLRDEDESFSFISPNPNSIMLFERNEGRIFVLCMENYSVTEIKHKNESICFGAVYCLKLEDKYHLITSGKRMISLWSF